MTKLENWIESQGGVYKLAPKLNITPSAIYYWLRGDGTPTVKMINKVVKCSKGQLTASDIINAISQKSKVR